MFGIQEDLRLYYEGSGYSGRAVWPDQPFVTAATIIRSSDDHQQIPQTSSLLNVRLIFREDFFDPVTRIRRGRFYRWLNSAVEEWILIPHPAIHQDALRANREGLLRRHLQTFHDYSGSELIGPSGELPLIALGIKTAVTWWRVIDVEKISTGEDLVTLKARSTMGVFPNLTLEGLSEANRIQIAKYAADAADVAHLGSPASIIDRCRDLAAAALGVFLDAQNKDLAALAAIAESQKMSVVANACRVLALLHSRVKPTEQFSRRVNHPSREDAEAAMQFTALTLREIGYAVVD